MKAICKDFWSAVFKKQVDNLRTNHQGVYVLQDNKFRFLMQMSTNRQYLEQAPRVSPPPKRNPSDSCSFVSGRSHACWFFFFSFSCSRAGCCEERWPILASTAS